MFALCRAQSDVVAVLRHVCAHHRFGDEWVVGATRCHGKNVESVQWERDKEFQRTGGELGVPVQQGAKKDGTHRPEHDEMDKES